MTTTQLPDTASPSPLEVDLAVLPKVSLHDHLDGGLRVGTVLDLAREASEKNPVFYLQYAHARICSIQAKAGETGLPDVRGADGSGWQEGQK